MSKLGKKDDDPVQEWVDDAEKLVGKKKLEELWKAWDVATQAYLAGASLAKSDDIPADLY